MPNGISRLGLLLGLALAAGTATADGLPALLRDGDFGLGLRYRFESVDQDGKLRDAAASTLRMRLNFRTGKVRGCSGFVEADAILALGHERYDDTRNGRTDHPVVADPAGLDLNQGSIECQGPRATLLRIGRQRIALDNERFVGAVGWRQNEQTLDALRIEGEWLPGTVFNYAFIDGIRRVFGPEGGTPPASLHGAGHLVNLKLKSLPVGSLAVYGYFLDFDDAPALSSNTVGFRYDGRRELADDWNFGWALEYARQREAGSSAADVDAHQGLVELSVGRRSSRIVLGREVLSGERGVFAAGANPAFQTPLATLHAWQGWADKFTTTPSAGIDDRYAAVHQGYGRWRGQLAWHRFGADAGGARYGEELDALVARRFGEKCEMLFKLADYRADGLFTDTRKVWLQFNATF